MTVGRKQTLARRRLGRDAWIRAARDALIRDGVEQVKIERLAGDLGATRAAFYYHFKSRRQLLDELLAHWRTTNTRMFHTALDQKAGKPMERMRNLVRLWIEEKEYSPAYDSAVRDWARVSPIVAKTVRRVDRERILLLKKIYLDLGFKDPDAFIRARITYFHQVGYYTLGLDESRKQRKELAPLYVKALVGK